MADGTLTHLSYERARRQSSAPLRVVEQSPAGAHGFPPPEPDPRERVEITAGHSNVYATRVDGMIWAEFATATNAIRCAELLHGLIELGALFPQPPPAPEAA